MAIYGIGSFMGNKNLSAYFIENNIVGVGWDIKAAPDLHQFIQSLKVGDIITLQFLESQKRYKVLQIPTLKTIPKNLKHEYIKELP